MVYVICSVRDAKSEVFGRPFFMQSVGSAIRSFDDEVNRNSEDNIMNKHPEDFSLYQLGSFDDQDGSFNTIVAKLLIQGLEVKKLSMRKEGIHAV